MDSIKRGYIYWVQLDPTIGSEIKKTRPALVVSNDQNNKFSELISVLPITSNTKNIYPFEVKLSVGEGGVKQTCKIKANQIRTVDRRRLSKSPLGPMVSHDLMERVNKALAIHLSMD